MNKLRNLKNRSNNVLTIGGSPQSSAASSPTTSPSTSTGGAGMFTKLSKRYANVKFLRSQAGRQAAAQPVSTGSYDLTTAELKREIGAPILISKTCIDMDTTDCRVVGHKSLPTSPTTVVDEEHTQFAYDDVNRNSSADNGDYEDIQINGNGNPLGQPCMSSTVMRKNRSKSANNLHKSELRVFLQRAPSLRTLDNNHNLSRSRDEQAPYEVTLRPLRDLLDDAELRARNDDDNSANSLANIAAEREIGGDAVNVPQQHPQHQLQPQHLRRKSTSTVYGSKDSLNREPGSSNENGVTDPHPTSREPSFARDSLATTDSPLDSRQSPSCELRAAQPSPYDLDARDLFRSIEELSAITRRLNAEVEDQFNGEVDREYCEHRDQLRPDQRRITLLRNKGQSVLNLNVKREKLGSAWSGLKTWIGEESGRIKEVVHKHAAMQRVGGVVEAAGAPGVAPAEAADQQPDDKEPAAAAAAGGAQIAAAGFMQTLMRKGSKQSNHSDRSAGLDDAEGQNGFEELRRYVKQGGDFGKDLAAILQERVDAEQLYAKSLSKMATKLNKACRDIPGSLADGWRGVATEMEARSEMHRLFSNSMLDDICKPLRSILDNQHKTRKAIETAVDKSARVLAEWRATEAKAKKSSHAAARENEKIQDAMLDVRIQRTPSVAMLHHQVSTAKSPDKDAKLVEKDCAKLDSKRRKSEELVKRADVEYYTLCIRAERARVEWEMSVLRGASILQSHENQRLASLKASLNDYLRFSQLMNPATYQICERLAPFVNACNVQKDLGVVKNIRRASEGPSEQLLPDFYCEHTTLAMNRERRKHSLVKLLQLVRTDLERERKSRSGLQVIAQSLATADNQNVTDKLYHIRSMLTYLEGARFKLQSALLELDHKPRGAHPLAPHIQITRDRTGLQQSILKVPLWLRNGDEADRLNEEFGRADLESALTGTGDEASSEADSNSGSSSAGSSSGGGDRMIDGHNDVLIKHFDRNFKRSQSNLEQGAVVMMQSVGGGKVNGGGKTMATTTTTTGTRNNKHSRRSTSPAFDRGQADGGSNQPDSDFDDFSSGDEDDELGAKRQSRQPPQLPLSQPPQPQNPPQSQQQSLSVAAHAVEVISRCRAIYNYEPKLYDELELSPGDLIEVHAKQEDGWWLGAVGKKCGIFPATYVEELTT